MSNSFLLHIGIKLESFKDSALPPSPGNGCQPMLEHPQHAKPGSKSWLNQAVDL